MSRMSADDTTWLALDQGGHASRALLFDAGGRELGEARVPIATRRIGDDRVEHDPEELVTSLREAATQVLAAGAGRALPVATGLATQRSSIVCWDRRTGAALSPVLSWQDRRAAAALEPLREHADTVRRLSGLPLSAHYGASKIRWCVDHLPAVRDAARRGDLRVGPLATFLAGRLSGTAARVDPANGSRTQLWDAALADWSAELLELFGVSRDWLPDPGTTVQSGTAKPGALALDIVTGDQSAVPFAWGAPREDTLYINLGTGAFLQRPTGGRRAEPGGLLASVLYGDARETLYSLEGTINGAASAIDWLAAREGLDPGVAWSRWESRARKDRAAGPLLFLNGVSGLGSPWWRSDFASRFVGEGDSDADARFAALVASIAFLVRVNIDELRRAGPITRAIVTGGLAQSDGLLQLIADLSDIELLRPAQGEATALGLFGLLTRDRPREPAAALDARDTVRVSADPGSVRQAHAGFERWHEAMRRAL
jgi:glycerol kinase